MKIYSIACIAAACTVIAGTAYADVKVRVQRVNYDIVGTSGVALLQQMDRKGPKHGGMLARAIAQTRYNVGWDIRWDSSNGVCRARAVNADLAIHYTYPRLAGNASPALKRGWAKFLNGVQKHEQQHGAIAKQMVAAAQRSVASLAIPNDHGCQRGKAEAKRRTDAIYAQHEGRQAQFDQKEHGPGGNVESLVTELARR